MSSDTSRVITAVKTGEEAGEFALRPVHFADFVGQEALKISFASLSRQPNIVATRLTTFCCVARLVWANDSGPHLGG